MSEKVKSNIDISNSYYDNYHILLVITCSIGVACAKNSDIELQVFIGIDSISAIAVLPSLSFGFVFLVFRRRCVVRR